MKVREIAAAMENIAPSKYALEWDNTGLLVGDAEAEVKRVMFCIDLTPTVLAEVRRAKAQMVIAYHPVIFKGLKRITAQASQVLWQAIQAGVSVYCPHTAFDVVCGGVNDALAEAVGIDMATAKPLEYREINDKVKVVVFVPQADREKVCDAAFAAGGGVIGDYDECSFISAGEGSFLPGENSNPTIGRQGERETVNELRVEMIAPREKLAEICVAIRQAHSYEEPAIDIYPLADGPGKLGMGRIGRLNKSVKLEAFIRRVKNRLGVDRVLMAGHGDKNKVINNVAVGAGSCGDMWRSAVGQADVFVTGEMRHHDALAATEAGLCVICVGHSNSERHALPLLAEQLSVKVRGVKMMISQADRDPFVIL